MPVNVLAEAEAVFERAGDAQAEALALVAIQLVYLTTEVQEGAKATGEISGFMLKIKEALEGMNKSGGAVG